MRAGKTYAQSERDIGGRGQNGHLCVLTAEGKVQAKSK